MTHSKTPWTHDGPDEFGDYSFTGPENALAIAVVVQNLRDSEVTKDTAEFLGTAVNSHDGLLEALEEVMDWIVNWEPTLIEDDEWLATELKVFKAITKAKAKP